MIEQHGTVLRLEKWRLSIAERARSRAGLAGKVHLTEEQQDLVKEMDEDATLVVDGTLYRISVHAMEQMRRSERMVSKTDMADAIHGVKFLGVEGRSPSDLEDGL